MNNSSVRQPRAKAWRLFFWLWGVAMWVIPVVVLAQELARPEYVIVVAPVMWSGDMADFRQAAEEELAHFIAESQIERYATVRVEILEQNLTGVSLADPNLPDLVQRHALPLASGDRYIGLTDGDLSLDGSSSVVGWTQLGNSAVVVEAGYSIVVAHELGHTFNLCDEYAYFYWNRQDRDLLSGCPNPYPDSCPRIEAPGVFCEGYPASDGSPSIMGPAMGAQQRYNDPSLIHLRSVFEQLFGTPVGPTPTLAPNETPLPTATPRPTATPVPPPPPQQLLVSAQVDGTIQLFKIETESANRIPEQLTHNAGPVVHAAWAPGGQAIVYASGHTGQLAVYVMDLNTRQERLLVEGGLVTHPAWSPKGDIIAFASDRDGELALYAVRSDGSDLRRLTPPGVDADWPAWSPEGERLAYASNQDGDWEIYHQAYDGATGLREAGIVRLTNSPGKDIMPTWSPQGDWIAFVSERDALLQVYIMPPAADELRRVTLNRFNDWGPTWLDNETLLFHSFRGDEMALFQISWRQRSEATLDLGLQGVVWPAARRR